MIAAELIETYREEEALYVFSNKFKGGKIASYISYSQERLIMDYRNFLRLEHDIHSYLMGISENGRIYNRSFEYTVRTCLMSIGIRVGFIHIEIEVETFMDENPIKMSVGERTATTSALSKRFSK